MSGNMFQINNRKFPSRQGSPAANVENVRRSTFSPREMRVPPRTIQHCLGETRKWSTFAQLISRVWGRLVQQQNVCEVRVHRPSACRMSDEILGRAAAQSFSLSLLHTSWSPCHVHLVNSSFGRPKVLP
jgi:hypothetical protein